MTPQDPPPALGATMPDGTVFAGISPTTQRPMYVTAAGSDTALLYSEARKYARNLNRQAAAGHNDWRLPTIEELRVLFNNRAAIGGFEGKPPAQPEASWVTAAYWSSTNAATSAQRHARLKEAFQKKAVPEYLLGLSIRLLCQAVIDFKNTGYEDVCARDRGLIVLGGGFYQNQAPGRCIRSPRC